MKNVLNKIIEYALLGALPSSDKHKLDYLFEFNFRQCGVYIYIQSMIIHVVLNSFTFDNFWKRSLAARGAIKSDCSHALA